MATQLLVTVLSVGPLAVGASITLPHGLKSADIGVTPTQVYPDRSTPIIVSAFNASTVTFTNSGTGVESASFRVERDYSAIADAATVTPLTWQGAASGGAAITALAQEVYVAKNGNDTTGDGSLSLPYLTIGRALTFVNGEPLADHYRINVSPGVYAENLSITRARILISGASTSPEQRQTLIVGTVTINPTSAASKFNDVVALSGLLLNSNVAATPTITVTGTQEYQVDFETCYLTSEAADAQVLLCDATNANRPIIYLRNSVINKQGGSSVPVIQLDRGDVRFDSVRLLTAVAGSGEGILVSNDASVFADRLQIDKNTSGAGIRVNTNAAGVSCRLSNSAITTNYVGPATSPALDLNNATGNAALVWQCLLNVVDTVGNNAIDGTFNGLTTPLIYGNLAYIPGTNTTIAAAVDATKAPMTVIP
jgi:hypothetical protein